MVRFLPREAIASRGEEAMELNFFDPVDLLEQTKQEKIDIPLGEIDGPFKATQDKWCAATFGVGYGMHVRPCRVAMNDSRERGDADFFLETAGAVFPFQTTECQEPGRKRGDEYRNLARVMKKISSEPEPKYELLMELLVPYRPALNAAEGSGWIERATERKVRKQYAGSRNLNLLVYANFTAEGMEVGTIRERAGRHRDAFASIWVITNKHICTLFSNKQLGEVPEGGWGFIVGE